MCGQWQILSTMPVNYIFIIYKKNITFNKKQFISSFHWMHWNKLENKDTNGLCISILLKNMVWYLGVIWNIHNNWFLIYILAGKVQKVMDTISWSTSVKHCSFCNNYCSDILKACNKMETWNRSIWYNFI